MSWVVLGIIGGIAIFDNPVATVFKGHPVAPIVRALVPVLYGTAGIGGMVVVGLMIRDFGICTLLG